MCMCVFVSVICYEWNSEQNDESLGTNRYILPKLRRLAVSSEKADSQVGIWLRDFRFSQRCCWRLKSSGMLRCVDGSLFTDVSKECCATTFRVKQSHKTWMWYFGIYGVVGIVTRLQTGHPRKLRFDSREGKMIILFCRLSRDMNYTKHLMNQTLLITSELKDWYGQGTDVYE